MSSQERTITLSIREAGTPPERSFLFQVLVDDEAVATNQSLSPEQARAVREFSRQYNSLFEPPFKGQVAADNLQALGAQLFDVWLGHVWDKVAAKVPVGAQRMLVIASDVPDVLNLPWELLRPAGGDFIGFDPRFCVRRLPWPDRRLAPFDGELPPRPLRILFMACAPQDQPPLDYDREEEALFKAIASAGPNVAVDVGDLGSFEELRQRINDFKPHVVHLTGHGIVKDGLGYFCFEDERGQTDLRSSQEIAEELLAGSGVQCAFISGCQTGKAPPVAALGGICQGLVSYEVPLAVGWAASIADATATHLATVFYNTLASGQPVDRALTQARHAIRKACEEGGDPSWTLPVLYSATNQGAVFDADPSRPEVKPPRSTVVQQPLAGMTEGYAEHFVGRRREFQRLLPALRDGALQSVLITGLGGAGKSTLATRLARRLETDGFRPIPVPSSRDTPLSVAVLLEKCGDAFLGAGLKTEQATLNDANVPLEARLRHVVSVLDEKRFVLVLDNFEVTMDEATRRIIDSHLAGFYTHLLTNLAGGSRAIVTSRYRPADLDKLPGTAHEEPLGDFPEAAFLKFLLRDEHVERRYYAGELPPDLLSELHRLLGGTPRFLEQIRSLLRTVSAEELRGELGAVKLPEKAEASVLADARDKYCEDIVTARLYGYLSPESRQGLSRAAVYNVAVNLEGLAAVTGEPVEKLQRFTRQWQDYALAYPERERAPGELWTVYGLLRGWLLVPERLSPDDRPAAHGAAGDFLRDLEAQDREGELGLSWVPCLLEARAQYLAADRHDDALAVTDRICGLLVRRGLYEEVVRLNEELLKRREHPAPMSWIGRAYADRGDYHRAREWYQRCLKAAGHAIPREASVAWQGLATVDIGQSDYGAARDKFQKALKIEQESGNRAGEAPIWHNLAMIDMHQGNYGAAREKLQKVLDVAQELADAASEAHAYDGLAVIDVRQRDYGSAREKFQRSLEIWQRFGDRISETSAWHNLAFIDSEQRDYGAARDKSERALQIEQEIGDRAGEAATWHNLGTIDLQEGHYEAAREKFDRSLKIKQQLGDRAGEAATWHQLGILAAKLGRGAEGARLVTLSFLIGRSIGHADAEKASRSLAVAAQELDYTAEQLQALLKEVAGSYKADRGQALLKAAFPDD